METEKYPFERYLNIRASHGASISPDGSTLSFLTNITGVDEIWSVPIEMHAPHPAWPRQLTFRGERVLEASFAPLSDMLLVVADVGGNERSQLYTLGADGSSFIALTTQSHVIHQFGGWSPSGTAITYSSNERDSRYFDVYERCLTTGKIRQLLCQDGTNHVYGYSPDGAQILVSHYESPVCNQLLLVECATGISHPLTPLTDDIPSFYTAAVWSVDRLGLYLLSNHGRQFLSLAYITIAGEMTYLTDRSWDIELLKVTSDGRYMALVTNEDGYSLLELFDVSNGWDARKSLIIPDLPQGVIQEIVWSQDGTRLAITFTSATESPGIWIWDRSEDTLWRATPASTCGIPQASFVSPSVVRYPTFDGREIPAFLYLPSEKREHLPVVVNVHGGPASQALPTFNGITQYLVAQGYAVLTPNVRGSTGYGYEYQSLDDVRLRMDSVADLQYAALWLVENNIANPACIAVMGGSYGGFMVLAALTTYPEIWAAGVDIVGIANFVTFLENTGVWRRKLRESEYGSLEHDRAFLEQISPVHSVDRIKAPLFIVHGANDPRVPVGEAEQIVAALHARAVPVEYLRFEDEGHGLVKRVNRLVAYPAIAYFLAKHLGTP